jgi:hypothetical protein
MKEFKRHHLIIISLSFCAVLIIALWFLMQKNPGENLKTDQFVQDKTALERLLQNSSEIQRLWTEGEDSREWNSWKSECLKLQKINSHFDESLLRCNPMLIECMAAFNKKADFHFVKQSEAPEKIYRYVTKSNSGHVHLSAPGYLFTIEDNQTKKQLSLLLADNCQEVFLENRAYAYGEEVQGKESEDYRFDNFNQNIYIDRHLVTNAEVNQWIDFGNPDFTKGLTKKSGDDLLMPATDLIEEQMLNYCSYKGKQLLLAHYFDAATFLPMDLKEVLPAKNNRSPYYWTKKRSEFKADCNLIYAQECPAKKSFQLNATAPTWAGVTDAMGGVMEAFRNPIDPESNLKASSFYFNFKSQWHRLGFRAGWDGEGFALRNFDFKGFNPEISIEKFQVGFRCMRESK